jgi:single-strand DNA-binding protein
MSFNSITILGNLTQDPQASTMPDGTTPTSRFGMATNSKVKGEDVPTFFRVNFIGKLADVANQYLAKGRQALVVGSLHLETYPKNDGGVGTSLEVRGTALQLVGSKPVDAAVTTGAGAKASPAVSDDDIPF